MQGPGRVVPAPRGGGGQRVGRTWRSRGAWAWRERQCWKTKRWHQSRVSGGLSRGAAMLDGDRMKGGAVGWVWVKV